jgi:CRP-like cAMP-binding protein
MEPRQHLASIPFFAEVLTGQELDLLAAGAKPVSFGRGDMLIREHDLGDSLFVVASGKVAVTIDDDHRDRTVRILGPGEIVGEMSMMTGAPRAATVTATGPVTALEIAKAVLETLFAAEPDLYERFDTMLVRRQTELDQIYGSGFSEKLTPSGESIGSAMRRRFG